MTLNPTTPNAPAGQSRHEMGQEVAERDQAVPQESEEMLRRLFEFAPDAILVVNDQGRIIRANGQVEAMFGYRREELLEQPVETLIPERFRTRHTEHRTGYVAEPRTRPMGAGLELYGRRKDGTEFPVNIMLSPMEVAGRSLVIAIVRDITERRRFQQALQEKNVELERANQAKDQFLAGMSHELRTPLNAIIGFTGTLLMRLPGPLTEDQERQLRTIQSSGKHLLAIINDMLDLAKIQSGKMEISPEPVVCQSLMQEVATALRPQAEAKGLRFDVAAPPQEITVTTDRRALKQILLNLANNAVKFTETGRVQLALSQRRAEGQNVIEIAVADTGIGIRPEEQSKLFHAFTQVDASASRQFEGTGLGLHLSQKLALLLGGQITCQSEFGQGSTFTLVLKEESVTCQVSRVTKEEEDGFH